METSDGLCILSGDTLSLRSILSAAVDRLQRMNRRAYTLSLLALLGIIILLNGMSTVPPQHYLKLSENPFVTRTDIDPENTWQENLLLPGIAFITKLNTPWLFYGLCFAILLGAYAVFAAALRARLEAAPAFLLTAVLLASPLTTVMLSWLGTPDGLTVLLTIPFLFITSFPLAFGLAFLGAFNHIAVIIAAVEILFLRWLTRDRVRPVHAAAALLGGGAGYGVVRGILYLLTIQTPTRFGVFLSRNLHSVTDVMRMNASITIFSLYNIFWILILISFLMFFRAEKKFFGGLAAVIILNGIFAFYVNDSTRNFSVISWGPLVLCLLVCLRLASAQGGELRSEYLQIVAAFVAAALLVPRLYSWDGYIHFAPFSEFIWRIGNWSGSFFRLFT